MPEASGIGDWETLAKEMTPWHTSAFRDEVVSQLDSDILSYGWLRQMAETGTSLPADANGRRAVVGVIISLVDSGIAVVGEARNENERVLIESWTERGEALRRKLESAIDGTLPEEEDWVFWLQLRAHFEKE